MTIVDLFKLDGRKALVTGAGRGTGPGYGHFAGSKPAAISVFLKRISAMRRMSSPKLKNWAKKPLLSKATSPKKMRSKRPSPA